MARPLCPEGFAGSLWEVAPGRGRKATYGPKKIQQVIDTTLQSKPKGKTRSSCRSLAQRLGVSKSTVSNIGIRRIRILPIPLPSSSAATTISALLSVPRPRLPSSRPPR